MKKILYAMISILFVSLFLSCSMGEEDNNESSGGNTPKTNSDVLIMMYLDGDNNLNDTSWKNLYDTQVGLMNLRGETTINVLALIDGMSKYERLYNKGGKTYLYKVGALTSEEAEDSNIIVGKSTLNYSKSTSWVYNGSGTATQEVDMSNAKTLYNFLNWANTNFTADKKILIFHNHGGGPYNELTSSLEIQDAARSICYDDTNRKGSNFYLSTKDISLAIQKTFGKVDLIVEDVCLECSIEEVYGLQDATNYLIASPNTTITNSYNYDLIIPYISTGASIVDIGKRFVDYNMEKCRYTTTRGADTKSNDPTCMELSLTLVDCSKKTELAEIKNLTSNLAEQLLADSTNKDFYTNYLIGKLYYKENYFFGFSFDTTYLYTQDLGVMAYLLAYKSTGIADNVKTAAASLYNKLHDSGLIVYGWSGGKEHDWYYSGNSSYGNRDFLKITDGKCAWGISITSGRHFPKISLADYSSWSEFGKDNKWADLLVEWKNTVE